MKLDIERLALLARIKLTPSEREKLQKEFEDILNYISKLKEVDIRNINDKEASRTTEFLNVSRKDENPNEPGSFSEILLDESPSKRKGYIRVKHVFK